MRPSRSETRTSFRDLRGTRCDKKKSRRDPIAVDEKLISSRNRVDSRTDKCGLRVARPNGARAITKNGPAKRSRHRQVEREMAFACDCTSAARCTSPGAVCRRSRVRSRLRPWQYSLTSEHDSGNSTTSTTTCPVALRAVPWCPVESGRLGGRSGVSWDALVGGCISPWTDPRRPSRSGPVLVGGLDEHTRDRVHRLVRHVDGDRRDGSQHRAMRRCRSDGSDGSIYALAIRSTVTRSVVE